MQQVPIGQEHKQRVRMLRLQHDGWHCSLLMTAACLHHSMVSDAGFCGDLACSDR